MESQDAFWMFAMFYMTFGEGVFYTKMTNVTCHSTQTASQMFCSSGCDSIEDSLCVAFSSGEPNCEICFACSNQTAPLLTTQEMFVVNLQHELEKGTISSIHITPDLLLL